MNRLFLLFISLFYCSISTFSQAIKPNTWLDEEVILNNYFDGYIDKNGVIGKSNGVFRVYYIPVTTGDKYRIVARGGITSAIYYAVYSNIPESFSKETVVVLGDVIVDRFQKIDIIIDNPESRFLAITWFETEGFHLYKLEGLNNQSIKQNDTSKSIVFHDIRCGSFDSQHSCVHHDNFYRQVKELPWHIGTNDPKGIIMRYSSPRSDYETVDDGFRIINNTLINDTSVDVEKSYRIIDSYLELKEEFFLELSNVKEPRVHSRVVFNFIDNDNYEAFDFYRLSKRRSIISYISCLYGNEEIIQLFKGKTKGNNYKIQCNNTGIRLFDEDVIINQKLKKESLKKLNELVVNAALPIALYIDKYSIFKYDYLNLYNITDLECYNHSDVLERIVTEHSNLFIESPSLYEYAYKIVENVVVLDIFPNEPQGPSFVDGQRYINSKDNNIYIRRGNKWLTEGIPELGTMFLLTLSNRIFIYDIDEQGYPNYIYQSTPDEKVIKYKGISERFELRSEDVHSIVDDRSENSEKYVLYSNLRKKKISFDVFLPIDYDRNVTGDEALFQFQLRGDYKNEVRQPSFTIATSSINGKFFWHSNYRSIPSKWEDGEQIIRHDDLQYGECKLGGWTHFDIFIQEGYDNSHSCLLIVKKDGVIVLYSTEPNTWNDVYGVYMRYGIYKSGYLYDNKSLKGSKRILYFSNLIYYS